MKTKKAMKTNFKSQRGNNVQKAFLRSVAVITSFVLISFTVAAQEFWKQLLTNNSFSEIAMVLVKSPAETVASNEKSSNVTSESSTLFNNVYLERANENSLEIESWMSDDVYFGSNTILMEKAVEQPLELENWMLDESYFNVATDGEKSPDVEDWMTNNQYWNS